MRHALCLVAYAALTYAVHRRNGTFEPVALGFLLVALVALLVAALRARPTRWDGRLHRLLLPGILTVAAWQLFALVRWRAGLPAGGAATWVLGAAAGAWLLALAGWTFPRLLPGRLRFPLVLAAWLALGVLVLVGQERPRIDVWELQQYGAQDLLEGRNPYARRYVGTWAWRETTPAGVLEPPPLQPYPFPPLLLLATAPGAAAGDVRWSALAMLAGAALLLVRALRRKGLPPGHPSELVVVLLLGHPRGLLVLHHGYKDHLLVLCAALWVHALTARRGFLRTLSLGLVTAAVQYGALLAAALPRGAPGRWRRLLWAALLAGATLVPFALAGPGQLAHGLVGHLAALPPRPDALNATALALRWTGTPLPGWAGFAAALLLLAAVVARPAPDAGRRMLAGASVLLVFLVLGKWAFLNYYWSVGALILMAFTCGDGPLLIRPGPARPPPDRRGRGGG